MKQTIISSEYLNAVKAIKQAILESRYRAARHVNKEVLALNYGIGRFISVNSRSAKWGSNAIAVISSLLRQELPGVKGYSEASIKMMRTFYEEWRCIFENRQLPIDDLGNQLMLSHINDKIEIRQLVTDELSASDLASFLNVGFTNHYVILTKAKSKEERLFYIRRCATEFWKVETTKYYLSENLFKKEGTIQQTNFNKTIDNAAFKQRALQSFKDEYLLDFVNIEDPELVDERVIEQRIIQNVKNFIMAFGADFTFMGNQYRLEVAGQEFSIDLLFFSRRLRSLVAFELKRGEFKPEYTGKMNFYLAALDKYVKLPDENPSIGIILCKTKNDEIVELSFSDTSKPMGVATYRTSQELPPEIRQALPDMEDLKKLITE
jgi:predicted nuclease of restriction endonuclease-like (RecB) superfamily